MSLLRISVCYYSMSCARIFLCSLKSFHYKSSSSVFVIPLKNYSKNSPPRNHYDVLGLKNTSSTKDVKKAYIKLCKELHPDMKPGDAAQHKKFVELNNAYSILINKTSRRKYDDLINETILNDSFHFKRPSKKSSSFDKSTEDDSWYNRDIYKQEREYFKKQRENAHITFRINQSWILCGCFFLVVVGYLLYYAAYSYAKSTLKRVDARSKKIRESFDASLQRYGENGKEKLMERWKKRLNQPEE